MSEAANRETVDLYYSFRSPYSYLVVGRLRDLSEELQFDVSVKVVLPLAVRKPDFFRQVNPLWPAYLMRDVKRLAEFHQIPYRWPRPDPVVQDIKAGVIPQEQPYIWRLCRLGLLATERGKGLEFIDEVSQVIWNGTIDGWDQDDHVAKASRRAGLDLDVLDAEAETRAEELDARLEANQQDLEAVGHWGVPSMVLDGEVFFGQDRLEQLAWRLELLRGRAEPAEDA